MTDQQRPSINPVNNDTLTGVFNQIFLKLMQGVGGVIPAQVINFKAGPPPVVQVQPLIKITGTDGLQKSRNQFAEVPVWQFGSGGFVIYSNIQPGDQGLLIACDRDISLFVQSGEESPPNTYRVKSFSDSFFLPMIMRGYSIADEDKNNFVIQNLEGTLKIAILFDRIKLTGRVDIVGDLNVDGDINQT